MANDPLGLSPDPTATDPQSEDYLGRMVPLAFKGQPALPVTGAAAVGSPSAPLNTGGGGGLTGTGGGATAGGSGFLDLARRLLNSGVDLSKLLGGGADLGTRGDTGGVSLSDYLRSLEGGQADFAPIFATDAAQQAALGQDVLALGEGAPLSALEAGGQVAAESAAETGLDIGLEGLGFTTAMLLPIIESFFGKGLLMSGGGDSANPYQQTEQIRKDFGQSFPVLKGASSTFDRFKGLDALPRDKQIETLQGIAQEGGYQLDQIPAVSEFTSTQGGRQGGRFHVDPVNVSGIEKQTGTLYMDAYLNTLLANDKLAQLGVPFPEDTTGTTYRNPLGELGPGGVLYQLAPEAGVDPNQFIPQQSTDPFNTAPPPAAAVQLTPEELGGFFTPGQLVPTIQAVFSRLNPDFASTPLGQRLAAFGGATPSGTETTGGAGAGPLTAPFTPLPGAEPSGGTDTSGALTAPLTAPFTPLPGTSGFGNLANAAMSEGGGGAELAKEQLGVA